MKIKRYYQVSLKPADLTDTDKALADVGITQDGWYDPQVVSVWYDEDKAPDAKLPEDLTSEAAWEIAKVACKIESRKYNTRTREFDVRIERLVREELVDPEKPKTKTNPKRRNRRRKPVNA